MDDALDAEADLAQYGAPEGVEDVETAKPDSSVRQDQSEDVDGDSQSNIRDRPTSENALDQHEKV